MAVSSVLEQYQIADFIDWWDNKRLDLNPHFQRRSVWTSAARSYLIQTILQQMPMPKIYMRTKIDVVSQGSVREIVDGQQRIRAILDFAKNRLVLTKRAGDYARSKYADLDKDFQNRFLSYRVSVEQLVNASDDDVLEVFARLNSYTVPLNPPELRHARYQGDFKWKVREMSGGLSWFWNKYNVLTTRDRLRMLDDSLTAEMFGVILEGVRDGGQDKIRRLLYDKYDKNFPNGDETSLKISRVIQYLDENLEEQIWGGLFANAPHFLMLFAAISHSLIGIPHGDIPSSEMPEPQREINLEVARENLAELTLAVTEGTTGKDLAEFVGASSGTTQRIRSRRVRFLTLSRALYTPL